MLPGRCAVPGWACLRIVYCMQGGDESTTVLSCCLKDGSMYAVTFLALGNGAPDISSSIAAISSGNYELALGALLGMSPTATTSMPQILGRPETILQQGDTQWWATCTKWPWPAVSGKY